MNINPDLEKILNKIQDDLYKNRHLSEENLRKYLDKKIKKDLNNIYLVLSIILTLIIYILFNLH